MLHKSSSYTSWVYKLKKKHAKVTLQKLQLNICTVTAKAEKTLPEDKRLVEDVLRERDKLTAPHRPRRIKFQHHHQLPRRTVHSSVLRRLLT